MRLLPIVNPFERYNLCEPVKDFYENMPQQLRSQLPEILLGGVPKNQGIFLVPLSTEYYDFEDAPSSDGFLYSRDKEFYNCIQDASKGAWKAVLVEAKNTKEELIQDHDDSSDDDISFYVSDESYSHIGYSFYDIDGQKLGPGETAWLGSNINFESAEDGGMVILIEAEDGMEDMWEGAKKTVSRRGDCREIIYRKTFMVVYSQATKEGILSGELCMLF